MKGWGLTLSTWAIETINVNRFYYLPFANFNAMFCVWYFLPFVCFSVSSGSVTVNDDSSVQILAEQCIPIDSLDAHVSYDIISEGGWILFRYYRTRPLPITVVVIYIGINVGCHTSAHWRYIIWVKNNSTSHSLLQN